VRTGGIDCHALPLRDVRMIEGLAETGAMSALRSRKDTPNPNPPAPIQTATRSRTTLRLPDLEIEIEPADLLPLSRISRMTCPEIHGHHFRHRQGSNQPTVDLTKTRDTPARTARRWTGKTPRQISHPDRGPDLCLDEEGEAAVRFSLISTLRYQHSQTRLLMSDNPPLAQHLVGHICATQAIMIMRLRLLRLRHPRLLSSHQKLQVSIPTD
jgi:hypothetical protein